MSTADRGRFAADHLLHAPRHLLATGGSHSIFERWLLGRLRHYRFYNLVELNAAIRELLRQLNEERPIRRLGVTRRALLVMRRHLGVGAVADAQGFYCRNEPGSAVVRPGQPAQ